MTLPLQHPLTQARYQVALRSRLLSHYNRYLRDQRGVALGKLSKAKAALRAVVFRMQGKPLPVKPVEYDFKTRVGNVPVGVVIGHITPACDGSDVEPPADEEIEYQLVTVKGYPVPQFIADMVDQSVEWDLTFEIIAHLECKKYDAEIERQLIAMEADQ